MTPYTGLRPDQGSTVPGTNPVEVAFTPALLPGPAQPGTGWLQPGRLVVHTGWRQEQDGVYRQGPA
jgi:hypothetical protein